MTRQGKTWITAFAAGVVATVAVAFAALLWTAYSGTYNIAATEEHASFTRWLFDTTFHSSVEGHADAAAAPEDITEQMLAAGAREYKETCQHCHAGPGIERAEWAAGMRPQPPHLNEAAAEWEMAEVFWLAKHGAKMTGMPAFGPTHDDETLWNVAAFVKELPAMTAEEYAAAGNDGGDTRPEEGG